MWVLAALFGIGVLAYMTSSPPAAAAGAAPYKPDEPQDPDELFAAVDAIVTAALQGAPLSPELISTFQRATHQAPVTGQWDATTDALFADYMGISLATGVPVVVAHPTPAALPAGQVAPEGTQYVCMPLLGERQCFFVPAGASIEQVWLVGIAQYLLQEVQQRGPCVVLHAGESPPLFLLFARTAGLPVGATWDQTADEALSHLTGYSLLAGCAAEGT